ncbi:hypothetical protein NCCP2495_28060 [Dietzia sp. NCCP-2495]|uniref:helix-turn-helix transcriptional regulator n=1 Tax=Dietzia sp. NCCP-2495 TaxID=2934675 RepID=UPI00222EA8E2|nr:helix-turn-helix domain-containing protein [Dietzia sp. NCCP-2495]GLB64926.1 hypothetical protein NCCP2495_28060 [Dietzia sp. NCCP-2495]
MAPRLLTVEEVAPLLRKSPSAFRWMIQTGSAPRHAKIGGRLYWREADVEAWIDAKFEEAS